VIALGGGALMNPITQSEIEKQGQLVFLSAQPETLLSRLKLSQNFRPLLGEDFFQKNPHEQRIKILALFQQREEGYAKAKIQLETDGLTPEEIALKIIEKME
jgi:shikimate kinase